MALGEAPENGRPEVLARALRRPPSRVPRSESKTAVPVQVADRQRSDLGAAQAGHESMQNSGPASPTLLPTEGHPAQAGLRDLAFLHGQDAASQVGCLPFLPGCAAYPGRGTRRSRPLHTLRTDAAARLAGWGPPATWPLAFPHLVAESARAGLRELDRLKEGAGKGGRPSSGATGGRGCWMRSMRCCGCRR